MDAKSPTDEQKELEMKRERLLRNLKSIRKYLLAKKQLPSYLKDFQTNLSKKSV